MKAALAGSEGHLGLCEDGARGLEGLASSNWRAGAVGGLEGLEGGWRERLEGEAGGTGLEGGWRLERLEGGPEVVASASSSHRRHVVASFLARHVVVPASSSHLRCVLPASSRCRCVVDRRLVAAASSRRRRVSRVIVLTSTAVLTPSS